jgi:type VI secretion system protein ImpA
LEHFGAIWSRVAASENGDKGSGMSAAIDDTLMAPLRADLPCGESLEDTPLLASFDTFRVFGRLRSPEDPANFAVDPKSVDKPVPPPDWNEVRTTSLEALGKSKDLRVLAYLAAAVLRTDGFPAFAALVQVASQWLELYWTQVYPQIDEDAILRRSALNCFADSMSVVDRVRRMPLTNSRQHGRFGLRDIELSKQPGAGSNGVPDAVQIGAAFEGTDKDELVHLHQSVANAISALRHIDEKMRADGGPEGAPDFEPLLTHLRDVDHVLRPYVAPPAAETAADAGATDSAAGVAAPAGVVGPIRSRQDALRALDAVADYFRQTEPSSPVPLFVARARKLVDKDFLEVLADIVPEALDKARAAGGVKAE